LSNAAKASVVFRTIINHVSVPELVAATVVLAVGGMALGIWLVRRLVPKTQDGFDAEVSSQMLGVVASLFGLLLAFVIVIEYQNFGSAQDNVGQEADSLAAITRDSAALAPSDGARVRGAIGTYVRAVVSDEWPRLREGKASPLASDDIGSVYGALQAARPTTPQATAFYNDSVRQLNEALIARRNRLDAAGGGLPSLVLALIVVGSLVILGYVMLVGSRSYWFHAIGACSIALVIVFSLVVLVDLSYPFSGSLNVRPAPFETGTLAQFFHK
jgi:Protein of unknown function (DUF4239)